MGSSRAEEQGDDSTGKNSQRVDEIEEAGTSSTSEDPGDVEAPNPTVVQQNGAGELPENDLVAEDAVFGVTEKDLEKYDKRERLLAEAYRVAERERKEREKDLDKHDKRERLLAEAYRVAERERKEKAAKRARRRQGYDNPVESDQDINDDDSCYVEIRNLVFIESSVIHKKALEEWGRKEKLFASRVERKSTEVVTLKNEVYQLLFVGVVQGAVLMSVSHTNLLPFCSPILFSSIVSFVIITGVFQKLKQITALKKTIFSEEQALKDVADRSLALRREGKDFVFAQFSEGKKKELEKGYSTWYGFWILGLIWAFTDILLISQWRILCSSKHDPAT